ncbi:hypothetical protein [Chitinophaga alhagiae]|uniref:hypothetical protein n=1 Tax=Chitinophaga alhagiae TaxID=2203219 RepID=UPI0013005F36|nr:hypothetical protein [Chitinophaga alhagiae]
MRKHLYYFMGVMLWAFSFSSCSKKDKCDPEDRDSPCYAGGGAGVKLLLTEDKVNGEVLAKFEYDSQNRRTRYILGSGTIEYSYNGKGFLSATVYKDLTGKITHREDYTYGSDDKPVSMVINDLNDKDNIPIDVQYTYSRNKIIETSIPRRAGAAITTNTYLFNEQGNLTDVITVTGGVESTNSWAEFDDKPSAAVHGDPYYWKNSKNNAQRFRVTSSVFNLEQKWVYTYNAEGYPIKALIYNNGAEDVAEEHVFSYKPAK